MKSVVKVKEEKDTPYPKLMRGKVSGIVVLFFKECEGTVVGDTGPHSTIGEFCDEWPMGIFEPFKGEVVLSN